MEITASVVSAFRDFYPEFSDSTTWPDNLLTKHLRVADQETGSTRWGKYSTDPGPNSKARGLFAFAAHRAVMSEAARKAVEAGGTPGAPAQAESKSVGDESVSYAVHRPDSASRADNVGNLQSTIYGQEFLRLRHRASMGAATTGHIP